MYQTPHGRVLIMKSYRDTEYITLIRTSKLSGRILTKSGEGNKQSRRVTKNYTVGIPGLTAAHWAWVTGALLVLSRSLSLSPTLSLIPVEDASVDSPTRQHSHSQTRTYN